MGNHQSLTNEEIAAARASSIFQENELRRLHRRFRKLDTDGSGTLTLNEFQAIQGLENNPLVKRVIDIFDTDVSGSVDFAEFISALSIFANTEQKAEKLRFAFKIYDVNNDGFISNGDLYRILKTMVGDNLDDTQLQQLVDRTIYQGDLDRDGKLSFEEFARMVSGTDVESKLKIDI
eukprot:TRINITY_DN2488_c0_g1_i1.p1 TRINITY_DN2488_c0_g1~~TRINITY_DN2488_c0_g1_i1.p1  ORF type:complete len:177 (-),score=55.00 TRINITY_DN2488_c0_g1_i1:288-818(-)